MTDIRELRRPPPPFRRVRVASITEIGPRLRRITVSGEELEGLVVDEPAASVRLLLPSTGELVIPQWTGNEFLLPDGSRPLIRTFTPRALRTRPAELDIDIVLHGDAGASGWARRAAIGDPVAVSGTGRGYAIDPGSDPLVLLGDETAIPAISQILEAAPPEMQVVVHIEVMDADGRVALPAHPRARVAWHDLRDGGAPGSALTPALAAEPLPPGARVWAAGEAAAMQQIRRRLSERGVDRSRATVRGYWKVGRAGPG